MMKVYVVLEGFEYEGESIKKIFLSKEKSEVYKSELEKDKYNKKYYSYSIEEFEVEEWNIVYIVNGMIVAYKMY